MSLFAKTISPQAAMCPNCGPEHGTALELIQRPINVREYVCSVCETKYSEHYITGYIHGGADRAKRHFAPESPHADPRDQ